MHVNNNYKTKIERPPQDAWHQSCQHSECTLHQLSPYIGKLKSSIAATLIEQYSKRGDLIVDPFSGSGTIPLEAALRGRRVFGADISPYARVLTVGKLSAPLSLESALKNLNELVSRAKSKSRPDLRKIPAWVRDFFHPETLREIINFSQVCIKAKDDFMLSCLLGILHHQRPGFLSYPSSHLVPYLRKKKFPRHQYPKMYEYRALVPRLVAKVMRVYKRILPDRFRASFTFKQESIQNLKLPENFDCLITSPPYMNMLDYGRDNRLRLWVLDPYCIDKIDKTMSNKAGFIQGIVNLSTQINSSLRLGGHAILIVGERAKGSNRTEISEVVVDIFMKNAPKLILENIMLDKIPDIRRSRRDCKGTKAEHVLIFKKTRR